MKANLKNAALPSEVAAQIEAKVTEIKLLMPYLVGLSTTDHQKLNILGRKSTQFVQRAVESVRQNPELAPSFLDAGVLERNYALYNSLLTILEPVQHLERMISDTLMVAGNLAYTDALDYYNTVKRAAKSNVPGAEAVSENLKTRFRQNSRSKVTAAVTDASGGVAE
jgi:hypothetical protein